MYKKFVSWILILGFTLLMIPVDHAFAQEQMQTSARSAIVMNADNHEILYEKNVDEKLAMASTTKIMTALLTLEYAKANNKVVTITDEMVRVEGSSMGLKVGNKLTLKNIAAGMLAISGNDAANSAAIAISGSKEAFAERMNQRAQELGMKNTHFVTPSGLDDEEHYSTARDMAVLACATLKNSDFAEIVRQKTQNVDFVFPEKKVKYTNHNKLLSQYEGCIGIKTGFTKKAGRCLVSAAERDGIRLVCITLKDPDDWKDHKQLLDYGFSLLTQYNMDDSACRWQLPVVGGEQNQIMVCGSEGNSVIVRKDQVQQIQRVVELPHFVYAPLETGQVIGNVKYILGGKTIASNELTVQAPVNQPPVHKNCFQNFWEFIKEILP